MSNQDVVRASGPLWHGHSFAPLRTGSACATVRLAAGAGRPRDGGRDARTTGERGAQGRAADETTAPIRASGCILFL
jgi:hypothetical protein